MSKGINDFLQSNYDAAKPALYYVSRESSGETQKYIEAAYCRKRYGKPKGYHCGAKNPNSKLMPGDVKAIRTLWDNTYNYKNSGPIVRRLVKEYRVSNTTIRDIVSNRSWQNAPLCQKPMERVKGEIGPTRKQKMEFTRQCYIEAAVKLAKEKKIWNVKKHELVEQAGGSFYKYFKSLDEVLRIIEPMVYNLEQKEEGSNE